MSDHDESLSAPPPGSHERLPSAGVVAHIQNATEHQKALLARELHDELGGLLVGAVMDVAWAEQHLATSPADLKVKLVRARQTLSAAIDLKRKLIENLRPTLLDNVGLFAALRWHVQSICTQAESSCQIELPAEERRFLPNIPIALFRIVQEALALVSAQRQALPLDFRVTLDSHSLLISIALQPSTAGHSPVAPESLALSALEHRIASLHGRFHSADAAGVTRMTASFPLVGLLAAA